MNKIIKNNLSNFEKIRHSDENGDFWYARELQVVLGYRNWRNFEQAIKKAKVSFKRENANNKIENHFGQVSKMVQAGSGAERLIIDYKLSRYACYLIAQNGDPTKRPIALAQAYFAIQTRRQEINDQMAKDRARLERRREFSESDKRLSETITETGVSIKGIGYIKDSGNKVFFGGNSSKDMAKKLGTGKKSWANKASNVVLAGKTLANELTSSSIEYRGVGRGGADEIKDVNDDNNRAVRDTIRNQQGLFSEEFPPEEDTEKIKRRIGRNERKLIDEEVE